MPREVRAAFETMAQKQGGMSSVDASDFVAALERDGRFQEETWA